MPQKGLSGSTLKLIAIITMLIDHIGAAVIARLLIAGQGSEMLYKIYYAMRAVGRVAFPIFCFLLVEGFFYTGSRKKYALRLFGFALLSEIPFDLAFSGKTLEFGYQNVFFTLLIGLLTIMLFDAVVKKQEWHPVLLQCAACHHHIRGNGVRPICYTQIMMQKACSQFWCFI